MPPPLLHLRPRTGWSDLPWPRTRLAPSCQAHGRSARCSAGERRRIGGRQARGTTGDHTQPARGRGATQDVEASQLELTPLGRRRAHLVALHQRQQPEPRGAIQCFAARGRERDAELAQDPAQNLEAVLVLTDLNELFRRAAMQVHDLFGRRLDGLLLLLGGSRVGIARLAPMPRASKRQAEAAIELVELDLARLRDYDDEP